MNSTQKKIALCLAATAFTGFGLYQAWKSKKRSTIKKRSTTVAALVKILDRNEIYIRDPARLGEKIRLLLEGGPESLQVVSDFDMTLTRYNANGKRGDTSHGSIEKASCMSEEFRIKASATKAKYYPLESSVAFKLAYVVRRRPCFITHTGDLTFEEKAIIMTEWWETIHGLIIDEGFERRWIPGVVSESNITLRDGTDEFFRILKDCKVPLYIASAGIGDIIEEAIKKLSTLYENTRIIANLMDFNEDGKLIGFKGNLIHSYNKHEVLDHIRGFVRHTKERHNLILFGDTLGDPSMADGMIHVTNELKIGFLNFELKEVLSLQTELVMKSKDGQTLLFSSNYATCMVDELLDAYQNAYDIVIVKQENWDVINVFLKELFKQDT